MRQLILFTITILLCRILLPSLLWADDEQLVHDIQLLAEQGDPEAQFSIGLRYDLGDGVERNPKLAAKWFTMAANSGIGGACLYLGIKYEFGAGVEQDKDAAEQWYLKAAFKGWPQAAFMLGNLYLSPPKVQQVKGCGWLTVAAEQGYPGAKESFQQRCSGLSKRNRRKTEKLVHKLNKKIMQ